MPEKLIDTELEIRARAEKVSKWYDNPKLCDEEGSLPSPEWTGETRDENGNLVAVFYSKDAQESVLSAFTDIQKLLNHIDHQQAENDHLQKALTWCVTHPDELSSICDACPESIYDGCNRRNKKAQCKVALSMDATKEAASE